MEQSEQLSRFREYLSAQGLKFTRQRRAIAEVFYESGEHLTLNDLLDLAREKQPSIGYATVYRTMKLLTESGLAEEHNFSEGQALYEPSVEGEHHDHIICTRCGRIVEFEDDVIESRQRRVAQDHGFRIQSHKHEIYGECTREPCPEAEAEE